MKHKIAIALLAVVGASAFAADDLRGMSDQQLQARWNKQADWYDKAYRLQGCTSKKAPNSDRSFSLCSTSGGKGTVSFRRKAGKLENVEYMPNGDSINSGSMFVRFVRGTHIGNAGQVSSHLLSRAQSSGNSCSPEGSLQICAAWVSGEAAFEVK